MIHEDNRRKLIEVISDEAIRSVKIIEAKYDCIVGDHYHKNKDENFYLISGGGTVTIGDFMSPMTVGRLYAVPRGTYHKFELRENSMMLGTASEPFDENDEIKM